ncbi:putative uncharacterized protein DDB_G0291812 [Lucilia sericata]|uniref:putative uncharacterized protein DDB_G0291812 n=1 Tax=Lucilia sericata TaxID=13632 RepID=UPI0018A87A40|nr:putative uncharacterized protein DDB_G0291812 [Lucilia sericata]
MRSGDLMIKTADMKSAKKFLKAKYIDVVPVTINMLKGLNSTQGRIFSRKIIDISEEDLLKSLEGQKVIEIRKPSRKEGEKYIPTGAAILTFDLIHRPETLKLGWERVRVNEQVPNPMRCANCQRLGHKKKEMCTIREAWAIFNDNPTIHTLKPFNKRAPTYSEILANGTIVTNNQNLYKDNNDAFSSNGIQKTTTTINANSSSSSKINNSETNSLFSNRNNITNTNASISNIHNNDIKATNQSTSKSENKIPVTNSSTSNNDNMITTINNNTINNNITNNNTTNNNTTNNNGTLNPITSTDDSTSTNMIISNIDLTTEDLTHQ